jgi:Leucine-rich repeat (LRR) protein
MPHTLLTKTLNLVLTAVLLLAAFGIPAAQPVRAEEAYDCSEAMELSESECLALVAIYQALDGPSWTNGGSWLTGPMPCNWFGVKCSSESVTEIGLDKEGLKGDLPAAIAQLPDLVSLRLQNNSITSLPLEIGSLSTLEVLDLYGNGISRLPAEVGNLASLKELDLGDNLLSELPDEIGNLAALEVLNVSFNQLSGLPTTIGSLGSLRLLHLYDNQLIVLPPEIGSLAALEQLSLSGNRLTTIPDQIGSLTALHTLSLNNNQLISIPTQIGSLAALESLFLDNNHLTALPPEIGNLTSLEWLGASSNGFSYLPGQIGNLAALKILWLTDNQLESLPSGMVNLTKLESLFLAHNRLASLPPFGGSQAALAVLDVSHNQLSGVPTSLGQLPALKQLFLHANPLVGQVPAGLAALKPSPLTFTYYDSGWCAPASGAVFTWLASVSELYSTGLICDHAASSISGKVSAAYIPPNGIQVNLYRSVEMGRWAPVGTTRAASSGAYTLAGLGQGPGISYRVQFVDLTRMFSRQYYSSPSLELYNASPLTIPIGANLTGINASLALAAAPRAEVQVPGGSVMADPRDGMVYASIPQGQASALTLTRQVSCARGETPADVTLVRSFPELRIPMTALGSSRYQAALPAEEAGVGASLKVEANCGGSLVSETVSWVGAVPTQGMVTDAASGAPIVGAVVTLFHVPGWEPKAGPADARPNTCQSIDALPSGGAWSQPAPEGLGMLANGQVLTFRLGLAFQRTTAGGQFGWDVSTGCWYVTVEAPGYAPQTSPVVGGAGITGLDLALTPARTLYLPLLTRR